MRGGGGRVEFRLAPHALMSAFDSLSDLSNSNR